MWSLLLASGYLKVVHYEFNAELGKAEYELQLTNREVRSMFERLIEGWFGRCRGVNNAFLKALFSDDLEGMNEYLNDFFYEIFSFFDAGISPSELEPERFYHGFVLGMMVELADRYVMTSNRESGFGRYDIMLKPRQNVTALDAIIIEFKVQDAKEEAGLSDTVAQALKQIERKNMTRRLWRRGSP